MEETEVLIIGQGLSGTWLSWWLYQAGISFKLVDQFSPNAASVRAAGLINPVTGRRLVTTWMIDELMPFAEDAYRGIGNFLNESLIDKTTVVDFFPGVQMLQAFQKRLEEDPAYLFRGEDREKYSEWFRYDFGWGAIQPSYVVKVEKLLALWRSWLKKNGFLTESFFDNTKLVKKSDGLQFADIRARNIIFCDGKSSVQNPYFEKLPFALNKGEALLVEIKGLPVNQIFKKGMSLVPWKDDIFWLGSSYEWTFADDLPSEPFRKSAEGWLKNFLKLPFTVLDHFAAIRPATLERRPFAGFHPMHPQIGILNGMGTKGCSLAPYFAKQLADQIAKKGIIDPLADIKRYGRILSIGSNN